VDILLSHRKASLDRVVGSSIVKSIMAGGVPKNAYASYLVNVWHYAIHSPKVIAIAGARCSDTHPELSAYLLHHAGEELGHDEWALSDLRALGVSEDRVRASRPDHACAAMIGMEYYWAAHANPVALFGWMFTLEALGDDVGHLIATALDKSLSLGGQGSYFLTGHGEADHDHIREITEKVAAHLTDPKDRADMMYVAELSSGLYTQILEQSLRCEESWLSN